MGQTVGKRRPIVKDVFLGPASRLHRRFERAVVSPVRQDLALYSGEIGSVRDPRVGHPAVRGRSCLPPHHAMGQGAQLPFGAMAWPSDAGRPAPERQAEKTGASLSTGSLWLAQSGLDRVPVRTSVLAAVARVVLGASSSFLVLVVLVLVVFRRQAPRGVLLARFRAAFRAWLDPCLTILSQHASNHAPLRSADAVPFSR